MTYKTPFQVNQGTIFDADGKKVYLFGVNYYAPFNHNFYNILELGKDHFKAVDEDFRHFQEMDIRFIRIHLYDREITDAEGNLVENLNLDIFDYVLEKAEQQNIYLMLTPIVWWNTVSTQIAVEADYAYWYTGSHQDFGFSNFYSKDSLIWHPEALKCQKRYFHSLFAHRGKRTGKRICDYSNIVAVEPFNEPDYIVPWLVETDQTPSEMWARVFSQGKLRQELKTMFWNFAEKHPELTDTKDICREFNASILANYFNELLPVVDEYFGNRTIKCSFASYDGRIDSKTSQLMKQHRIEAVSFGAYLNTCAFDGVNTDSVNHLPMAEQWLKNVQTSCKSDLARIIYEFDATGTQNGYPLAALAAAFRETGIQMAAYFTYTPAAVAQWNPGWLVHYLAMEHTPSKAAGFAVAASIFHSGDEPELVTDEGKWQGRNFLIERNNDLTVYADQTLFCYSNDTDIVPPQPEKLVKIFGRGKSELASCSGNGCYVLEKISEKQWLLHLHPAQKFLADLQRGRQFRPMANRWISCLKEAPVSQLLEQVLTFRFSLGELEKVSSLGTKETIQISDSGSCELHPGDYLITLR